MQYKNILSIIIVLVLMNISIFFTGCTDNDSTDGETPVPTDTATPIPTDTATPDPTVEPTQTIAPTPTGPPQEYTIRIDNYMFLPSADKEINVGDTIQWRNFEDSKKIRYLVSENGIWEEDQQIRYMRYIKETFNETGVFSFYLKGRESTRMNITVV